MLKKKQRLTKLEFDRHFKTGRRYHSNNLQVIFSPGKNFHGAVVVGKKVNKTAVKRNRLRRQLYNALYYQKQQANLLGTYIVIAKPAARDLTSRQVGSALSEVLAKVSS